MEPLRIYLENFMGHRLTDIDCTQFKSALIVGRNKYNDRESNGVGKTTIFKAIDYALFGEYPTKTVDKVVRDGADRCRVIFDFDTGSGIFRVSRGRNKKSGKSDLRLYEQQAGTWQDLTQKTASEVEAELAKIIKISYRAFQNSVLFAQSDLSGLASSTPEARRTILKEALNLVVYSKFEKLAKEKVTIVTDQITLCKATISVLGKPLEEIPKLQARLIETQELIKHKEQAQEELQDAVANSKAQLAAMQKLISSDAEVMQGKLSTLLSSKKNLQTQLNSSKKVLTEKEASIKSLTTQVSTKTQMVEQYKAQLTALKGQAFRPLTEVRMEIEAVIQNEANGRAFIAKLEADKVELETPFPEGDTCPHCRQHLSPEHKNTCLQKVAEDLAKVKSNLVVSTKRLETIRSKRVSLEKESKEISAWETSIHKLEQQIATISAEVEHNRVLLQQTTEMTDRIRSEIVTYSTNLEEINKSEEELKADLLKLDLDNLTRKNEQLKLQAKKQEDQLQSLIREISLISTQEGILTEKLANRQQDSVKLDKLLEELKVLEKEQQLRQMVAQSFASGGIPTMIIYTILDDLQIEANKLLNQIRPGLELQFSIIKNKLDGQQEDTLDITYRIHGVERDYEQLSGGQKLMVALSLKLGLSLVIQHRLSTNIKFLELDEVDQSLDKAGVDAFADVIKQWQDKFKIFVITHNDALKTKFSNAILVEHEGSNGSVGKAVTTW